jgi:DNA-binding NarL/FixJ family response regulator
VCDILERMVAVSRTCPVGVAVAKPGETLCIRVIVVDDHPVVRAGVSAMLQAARGIDVVAQATNGAEAIRQAELLKPDVMLVDIRLPGASGMDVCRTLRRRSPATRVIFLTSFEEEEYVQKSVEAGAYGYLAKTASQEEIVEAITRVAQGQQLLTSQAVEELAARFSQAAHVAEPTSVGFDAEEMQILKLVTTGATNSEIAHQAHWSDVSVKRRLQAIFDKLGVDDRTSAAVEAMRRGLV